MSGERVVTPEDREDVAKMAYSVLRIKKPEYPEWDDLDESCREANRQAFGAAYLSGVIDGKREILQRRKAN